MASHGNICWFTNLDIEVRHQPLELYKLYSPLAYPSYDDFDGIHISKTENIPENYDGIMGVPITYLNYHCQEQFEIVGLDDPNQWLGHGPRLNGKVKYRRLLIRKIE